MKHSMAELQFEKELIDYLCNGNITLVKSGPVGLDEVIRTRNWEYLPNVKTEEKLWENFKKILEQHNQQTLDRPLSDAEFNQVKKVITDINTPFQAGQFLYGMNGVSQVEVDLDDGRHVFLTVFDQSEVGAGDTVYQIVNQVERPAIIPGKKSRRFDVTLLINGLPVIQIELKKDTGDVDEALNQMHQYILEKQYTGIYSTLQLLVGMTPYDAKYMANTTGDKFNKGFSFHWQKAKDNKIVRKWQDFSDYVLTIPAAHNLSTNYMILDGTQNKEALKVMRPYQVAATEKAISAIKGRDIENDISRLGYIWHTTGSGKTITSFKTAWLASNLPMVDKVVFLVDRKQLTSQTLENYRAYDPESSIGSESSIAETNNTRELMNKLKDDRHKIIITSVQKLDRLVKRKGFKAPDKNIVFIVDEAHRSTSGNSFNMIQRAFKHAAWLGYTGTPVFEPDPNKPKTKDLFGDCLHSYTIKEAIKDKNVLGFHVDFKTTIPENEVKEEYLPEYYRKNFPQMTEEEIKVKIENLTDEDFDDDSASFYDNNPRHIQAVVKDIFDNWDARSNNSTYNAMLTTHVGGGRASSPMALQYYKEFKRVNEERRKNGEPELKVAVTFTEDDSNKERMIDINEGLSEAIQDYNKMFGTSFGLDSLEEYKDDLQMRMRKASDNHKDLDLVIVVDQLLTGFDAPCLNTLYVDRSLKGAGLVQAYSRTNRLADMQTKPFGNIINYRWPKKNEELMNKALTMYADKSYEIDGTPPQDIPTETPSTIVAPPFSEALQRTKPLLMELTETVKKYDGIPTSDKECLKMFNAFSDFNAQLNKLKQYDSDEIIKALPDAVGDNMEKILQGLNISEDDFQILTKPIYTALKSRVAKILQVDPEDVGVKLIQIKEVKVDYDYLIELLEKLMDQKYREKEIEADKTLKQIKDFANNLDDRQFAEQIIRASEMIRRGEFKPEEANMTYPYKIKNGRSFVLKVDTENTLNEMTKFINKWGLQSLITPDWLKSFISHHKKDTDDLNDSGALLELQKKGQDLYKEYAEDERVREMRRLQYRKELRNAIYQLANEMAGR